MDTPTTIREIISNLGIKCGYWYIVFAFILAIIIRLILCIFKAIAIKDGEVDAVDNTNKTIDSRPWKVKRFGEIYKHSFLSNGKDIRIDDYWFPFIIGIVELLVFPVLMTKGWWTAIAAWIAIKTASSWGGWQKIRTSYNRFLFGNILSLACSLIIAILCF